MDNYLNLLKDILEKLNSSLDKIEEEKNRVQGRY